MSVASSDSIPPQYLTDASGYAGTGDKLFVPSDEAGVLAVLNAARVDRIPVTLAGAGSGLTGGRVPRGGWVLSLEKFRRLEIGPGRARTGSAITLFEIREAAAPTRQFYAPDPTEITASI